MWNFTKTTTKSQSHAKAEKTKLKRLKYFLLTMRQQLIDRGYVPLKENTNILIRYLTNEEKGQFYAYGVLVYDCIADVLTYEITKEKEMMKRISYLSNNFKLFRQRVSASPLWLMRPHPLKGKN